MQWLSGYRMGTGSTHIIFRCRRVEPPALGDSTINCDVDWLGENACIAASLGLVDTTKKRWDPPYEIFRCRAVEPPALGDSTINCDVDWLGENACIAASLGLVDTTKKRWDPPT